MMKFEDWRKQFSDDEAAAKAAYKEMLRLQGVAAQKNSEAIKDRKRLCDLTSQVNTLRIVANELHSTILRIQNRCAGDAYPNWENTERTGNSRSWILDHTNRALDLYQPKAYDKCEVCAGTRGGVPGNENIIDGTILCDYCSADAYKNSQAHGVTPEGWKLVPIEPTKEMVDKACCDHGYPCGSRFIYVQGYRSMIEVSPEYIHGS